MTYSLVENEGFPFKCPKCPKRFRTERGRWQHDDQLHKGEWAEDSARDQRLARKLKRIKVPR